MRRSGPKQPEGKDTVAFGDVVDRTLIVWMLSLSAEQRLQVLQDHVDLVASLRRAGDTH